MSSQVNTLVLYEYTIIGYLINTLVLYLHLTMTSQYAHHVPHEHVLEVTFAFAASAGSWSAPRGLSRPYEYITESVTCCVHRGRIVRQGVAGAERGSLPCLRAHQHGQNTGGNEQLRCSGIELYGLLTED